MALRGGALCPAFARAAPPLPRFHCDCFSRALYGKAIDKVSEKNPERAAKIYGFAVMAPQFAFATVAFFSIVAG